MAVLRPLIVIPLALLLAVVAIRAMAFVAPASHPLRAAQQLFPGHPDALANRPMAQIGASAAAGGGVPDEARRAIATLAVRSPLAPEPFLVEGTIAELAGDARRAEPLFLAARTRDPRSEAARYFLADRYLKTDRILAGLIETGALARLSGNAAEPLIPALAAYARSPGALPELRRFFRLSPDTRDRTLSLLASDPRNLQLVLALAPPPVRGAKPPDWQGQLVRTLVESGDIAGAERIWIRFSGIADRGLLYNPQFRDTNTSPPFNWELLSGSAGVAEASGGGGLDVIYYGRENVVLARQMLRLAPGSYRLAMRVEGSASGSGLAWTVQCLAAPHPFARVPIDPAGGALVAGRIVVPADCPAQWLDLSGQPADRSSTAQVTISNLTLERAGAGS